MTTLAATHDGGSGCLICQSKNQQIQAKDEVIRAKDAVIAAKDDAIAQKDLALKAERELREQLQKQLKLASAGGKQQKKLTIIASFVFTSANVGKNETPNERTGMLSPILSSPLSSLSRCLSFSFSFLHPSQAVVPLLFT